MLIAWTTSPPSNSPCPVPVTVNVVGSTAFAAGEVIWIAGWTTGVVGTGVGIGVIGIG